MCSKQWFVNWKLWSQNIDISPAMSLNDYLVVDIGFEQRPVNWNLLNQNLLRYFSIHLNNNFSLKCALNNELWI